jgi:hypothetical protein
LSLGVDVRVDPNQADCKADYSDYNEQLEIQKIRLPNEADFLLKNCQVVQKRAETSIVLIVFL